MSGTKEASQRWVRRLFKSRRSISSSHHQETLTNFKQDHRTTTASTIDRRRRNNRPGRDSGDITAASSRCDQHEIWRTSQQDHRAATRKNILLLKTHGAGRRNLPFRRSHSRLCYRVQTIWHLSTLTDERQEKGCKKKSSNIDCRQWRNLRTKEKRKSEGCHLCQGARTDIESLPFRCNFWAFWLNKDMEKSCRKVLLARNGQPSEGNGTFSLSTCY